MKAAAFDVLPFRNATDNGAFVWSQWAGRDLQLIWPHWRRANSERVREDMRHTAREEEGKQWGNEAGRKALDPVKKGEK